MKDQIKVAKQMMKQARAAGQPELVNLWKQIYKSRKAGKSHDR